MSLRARLLIVLAVLLAAYAVAAALIVSSQRDLLIDQVDARLAAVSPGEVAALAAVPPPGAGGEVVERAPGPVGDAAADALVRESPFSQLYIGMIRSDGVVANLLVGAQPGGVPDIGAAVRATGGSGVVTVGAVEGNHRYRVLVMPQPESGAMLVVAQPLAEVDAAIGGLARTLWIVGGVIAVGLGLAVFWIERLGLRPIARVTATAEAIAAGDRAQRVDVADARTEAGKLGDAFNVMLDERDAVETRLRQFVADASHELRTPLTSVRGYLELYQQGAFRDPAELDDVVRRLSAEAARMHGLVEDLLALASLDEGRPLRIADVDVAQLLADAAGDARVAQPGREIAVQVPAGGVTARADEALLVQLVGILVANALAHTPVVAPVTLSAGRDDGAVTITVADRGPGLDSEVAARVFDRFWRGEESRARHADGGAAGSTGLGLAIARSIAEAHGGTIALETAPGAGCAFTVRLPVAPLA